MSNRNGPGNHGGGSGDSGESPSQNWLLAETVLRSPLEALRQVSETRIETAQRLGETAKAEELRRAHELARATLAKLLGEGA